MGDENKKPIDIFIEKLKETCSDASGFICIPFKDINLDNGKGIVGIDLIAIGALNIDYASRKLFVAKERAAKIRENKQIAASCKNQEEIEELLA